MGERGRKLGGDGAAKKVIRLLAAMTNWAVKRKMVKANPFSGQTLRADGMRTEIIEGNDYYAIFAAIDNMERDGRLPAREGTGTAVYLGNGRATFRGDVLAVETRSVG